MLETALVVGSELIAKLGYDSETRQLTVWLKVKPDPIVFGDVPTETFEAFKRATSKGAFFNQVIKQQFSQVG